MSGAIIYQYIYIFKKKSPFLFPLAQPVVEECNAERKGDIGRKSPES